MLDAAKPMKVPNLAYMTEFKLLPRLIVFGREASKLQQRSKFTP
jgi:hypothetical protein